MKDGDYAELYVDDAGEFRTRIKAANHEIIFTSGEGYHNKVDALNMLVSRFPNTEVFDATEE